MPYRPFNREQAWLMPPSLGDLVPEDHPSRFVAAFVDSLDAEAWEELGVDLKGEIRGAGAYHPRALLSIWIYGFMTGVRSCRKLEAACGEQVPYMWLAGMQRPDHNTLWRFYTAHRDRMRGLLRRTVRTAVKAGLVDLALQAVDGTRVESNASGERTLDAEGLKRLLERTEAAIEELEAQDTTGAGPASPTLPSELASAEALRDRVEEALASVERDDGPNYVNLTDADAGLLRVKGGFITGYNAQTMVAPMLPDEDGTSGMVITAVDVSSNSDDHPHLLPMIEAATDNIGTCQAPITVADAGYHSGPNLAQCASSDYAVLMPETHDRKRLDPYHKERFTYCPQTDTYLCPKGKTLSFKDSFRHRRGYQLRRYRARGSDCVACPAFGDCTTSRSGRSIRVGEYDSLLQMHRHKMAVESSKDPYRRRKAIVEPVFGLLKERHDARRFLLRGRQQVLAEWGLLATAFNLKSLHRAWTRTRQWAARLPKTSRPTPDPLRTQSRCLRQPVITLPSIEATITHNLSPLHFVPQL